MDERATAIMLIVVSVALIVVSATLFLVLHKGALFGT